jgi:hypothetical protein
MKISYRYSSAAHSYYLPQYYYSLFGRMILDESVNCTARVRDEYFVVAQDKDMVGVFCIMLCVCKLIEI